MLRTNTNTIAGEQRVCFKKIDKDEKGGVISYRCHRYRYSESSKRNEATTGGPKTGAAASAGAASTASAFRLDQLAPEATEGSVAKHGNNMEQMSLTPEVKADLERLAAHSLNEEERKQAQAALKELEERAGGAHCRAGLTRTTLSARASRSARSPVRSSTADNANGGTDISNNISTNLHTRIERL